MNKTLTIALVLMSLSACGPQSEGTPSSPSAPSASATPEIAKGGGSPDLDIGAPSTTPAASAEPPVQPTPEPSQAPENGLPARLAGIRFGEVDRFLNAKGQSSQLQIIPVDRQGNTLETKALPLEWESDQPEALSVNAEGLVTALVNDGYATITARVSGTDLEARTLINVTAPHNSAPVIESLSASNTLVEGTGTLVQLLAQASDAQSTLPESSYTWSCSPAASCGSFTPPTGSTVYWSSPNTSGNYTLTLTVSDGSLSSEQSVEVEVQTGIGQINVNPPPP